MTHLRNQKALPCENVPIEVQSSQGRAFSVLLRSTVWTPQGHCHRDSRQFSCCWQVACRRVQRRGSTARIDARQTVNFNGDWKFAKGSQAGAEKADFDDSAWQAVRLPHDWAISGPFNPSENGYAGKLPWKGEGWYRKTFTLDKAADGRRVYFDFDGVMAFPKGLCERAVGRPVGLWLYVVPRGCHALREIRPEQHHRGLCGHAQPRHPLVPRRGDLPQGDDDDLQPGARGPLGHDCDHAERGRQVRNRSCALDSRESSCG